MKITRRYDDASAQHCNNTTACPAVLGLENGDFLVIGKVAGTPNVSVQELVKHGAGIGPNENAVVVPAEVLIAAAKEIAKEIAKEVRS